MQLTANHGPAAWRPGSNRPKHMRASMARRCTWPARCMRRCSRCSAAQGMCVRGCRRRGQAHNMPAALPKGSRFKQSGSALAPPRLAQLRHARSAGPAGRRGRNGARPDAVPGSAGAARERAVDAVLRAGQRRQRGRRQRARRGCAGWQARRACSAARRCRSGLIGAG